MSKRNLLFFLLIVMVHLLAPSYVYATGSFIGRVYMTHNGRQFPLKDVFVDKMREDKPDRTLCHRDNPEKCLSLTNPEYIQPYYSGDDGIYRMAADNPTLFIPQLNQRRNYCGGDTSTYVKFGCDINCGEKPQFLRARFPDNFNIKNFPFGADFRKGHWKAYVDPNWTHKSRVVKDKNNNEFVIIEADNGTALNFDFEWIPDPFPIRGTIKRSDNNQPASGVKIVIIHNNKETGVTTDNNGAFTLPDEVNSGDGYAVRIPDQPHYSNPKTSETDWTFDHYQDNRRNTPLGSSSYEHQKIGADDCAGINKNTGRVGRCDFKVDTDLPAIASTPPPPASICRAGLPENSIVINQTQTLPLNSNTAVPISLEPVFTGQQQFIIPLEVKSNLACKVYNLRFNYSSPGGVNPSNQPFFRTREGDVHSNVKIEQ